MKLKTDRHKNQYKPITFTITCETLDELKVLYAKFNTKISNTFEQNKDLLENKELLAKLTIPLSNMVDKELENYRL